MPSREWLEKEITINRDEMSEIIAEQVALAVDLARITGSEKFANQVQELLLHFSAMVCAEMFGEDDLEVE